MRRTRTPKPIKLKFFHSPAEVISYLTTELLATLEDDLRNEPGQADLKDKIRDIKIIETRLVVADPLTAKREAFIQMIAGFSTEEEFGEDQPASEDWVSTVNDLIVEARKLRTS